MSEHDEDRPEATPRPEPQDGPGLDDTQPVGSAGPPYPPPDAQAPPPRQQRPVPPPAPGDDRPGPHPNPYGFAGQLPAPTQPLPPYPQQGQSQQNPWASPPRPGPSTGPYSGPAPAPVPYAAASPTAARPAQRGHLPGWAWPVITAIALVTGLLGGVLGALLVTASDRDGGSSPVISADNGAPSPLKADNGSVAAVAQRVLPSAVQVLANGGADGSSQGGATGSGFVLDSDDHVVTNNHVVADATGKGELQVVDSKGRRHAARIVGRSPTYDLAVLDVSGASGLRPASIGSSSALRVGDTVVAIGSPLGLSSTVTSGIVSATDRPVTTGGTADESSYINALQTDAAINPGNSGGPLVNLRGQVIGVNSAIATTGGAIGGESGNIGVGFAIPMEQVRITAGQILDTGKARYPVIGASVDTGEGSGGAKVTDVPSGTPAAAAGLRKGDVVVTADGTPITDGIGLIVAIRSHQPGQVIDLGVERGGDRTDVKVRLDSRVG